jgi:DNA gyrase/topoisomerase IV subunit B
MYIGHPDSFALWTICRELGDNAVDEFLADRNTSVHIINDGSYMWCLDSGDGVPVGIIKVKTHGHTISMPAIEAIFGMTHTGGKMVASEDGAYSGSRGTHGIGATATNAMSSHFQVWTKRDGVWYTCSFEKGHLSEKLSTVRTLPKLPFGLKAPRKGTLVRFKPDMTLFDKGSKLRDTDVEQWCEITSYLNGGFKVSYTNASGNTRDWYSENGSEDYLTHLLETAKATALGDYLLFSDKQIDLALAFTDYDGVDLRGYTNGLYNSDGGLHVQAVFKALSDTLLVYKTAKQTFTGVDLREGIIGIINFKIAAPAFSSQTKEKLIDERVKEPCYETVYEVFESYFKTHKALAKKICDRVQELKTLKNEFADNKRVLKELKTPVGKRSNLPSKLVPSIGGIPADRELFIVEGDSAGGSAAKARDKTYQEMLPLKGKILNVYKTAAEKVLASEEILNILKSIGYDPSKPDPMRSLRVGKIILLGDADADGGHINTLNMCLLARYIPQVIAVLLL